MPYPLIASISVRAAAFVFKQLHKEAEAFVGGRDEAGDSSADVSGEGERTAAGDAEDSKKTTAEESFEDNEETKDAREMKKAMDNAVAEQHALAAAEEDKKALGVSIRRVAELEVCAGREGTMS